MDVVPPLRCEHFHIRHKFFPVRQENGLKRKRLHKRRRGINNLWGKKKQINLLSILLVLWINISRSKSLVMLTCIPWNSLKRCKCYHPFFSRNFLSYFSEQLIDSIDPKYPAPEYFTIPDLIFFIKNSCILTFLVVRFLRSDSCDV